MNNRGGGGSILLPDPTPIDLIDILPITNPRAYKLHLACHDTDFVQPLDEYVADSMKWDGWNATRGRKNDWTRPFILSFMEFYHRKDTWLFGGVYAVQERNPNRYKLSTVADFEKYTGRLLASFHRYQGMRGRGFYLEKYLDKLKVAEILPQTYTGESFPGFENIDHQFSTLEAVFRNERADWKAALGSVKGIYLITDKSNGKHYVGSAYGDDGIWSRWAQYVGTGHGGNEELVNLLKRQSGLKYARENFHFSILEVMARATPDEIIINREGHWKRVLLTREHGYNKN